MKHIITHARIPIRTFLVYYEVIYFMKCPQLPEPILLKLPVLFEYGNTFESFEWIVGFIRSYACEIHPDSIYFTSAEQVGEAALEYFSRGEDITCHSFLWIVGIYNVLRAKECGGFVI